MMPPYLRLSMIPGSFAAGVGAAAVAALSLILFEPWTALASATLAAIMAAITYSDVRRMLIPDVMSLPAIVIGLSVAYMMPNGISSLEAVAQHALGAACGTGAFYLLREVYYRVRGVEGLGLGDVKLAGAAGAWVGIAELPTVIALACATALAYVLILSLRTPRAVTRQTALPFGAFLAPSIWFTWAFAQFAY